MCLYTKHKTQKRKKWLDGKLVVQKSGVIHLFSSSASNSHQLQCYSSSTGSQYEQQTTDITLDTLVVSLAHVDLIVQGKIQELQTEQHLIQIDGPWTDQKSDPASLAEPSTTSNSSNGKNNGCEILKKRKMVGNGDNGMQKLLSKKFQMPSRYIPSREDHVGKKDDMLWRNGRRRRPLQPGEYLKRFQQGGQGHDNNALCHPLEKIGSDNIVSRGGTNHVKDNFRFMMSVGDPNINGGNHSHHYGPDKNQQQEHHHQQQQHAHAFVTNDYNPNAFYGSDNEDDDGVDNDEDSTDIESDNITTNKISNNNQHSFGREEHSACAIAAKDYINHSNTNYETVLTSAISSENQGVTSDTMQRNDGDTISHGDLLKLFNFESSAADQEHEKDQRQSSHGMECSKENHAGSTTSNNSFLEGLKRSDQRLDEDPYQIRNGDCNNNENCYQGNPRDALIGIESNHVDDDGDADDDEDDDLPWNVFSIHSAQEDDKMNTIHVDNKDSERRKDGIREEDEHSDHDDAPVSFNIHVADDDSDSSSEEEEEGTDNNST